jgi:hypothetical protein
MVKEEKGLSVLSGLHTSIFAISPPGLPAHDNCALITFIVF